MAIYTTLVSAAAMLGLVATATANPMPHMAKRCSSCGGWGSGWGSGINPGFGWGSGFGSSGFGFFPFASSATNQFGANNNFAHFNDDTLYVNNKDAITANSNVNTFNNANVIA
ncbi:hypothetical protein IW143_001137 [Coemansia sp. RSA 520]|nr:hypothetical protein IW143_001137 [Coemansia sp. RSA 520]KAJ2287889.1 hypothetical protein IW141_004648 [Coemansia sp. RSA 355]